MTKILILEGVSTCGKTTVKNLLSSYFDHNNITYQVIEEETTLLPLRGNKDADVAKTHLKKVLKDISTTVDIIIFDRFQISHMFRTHKKPKDFEDIEKELLKYNAIIIFLKLDEDKIWSRIQENIHHYRKGDPWVDYVNTIENPQFYYENQQLLLLQLLQETLLNHEIYEVDKLSYEDISKKIIEEHIT